MNDRAGSGVVEGSDLGAMEAGKAQQRVERGIWIYLAIFFLLSAFAWKPFLVHGPAKQLSPLSDWDERFGDLEHFARDPQILANPDLEDGPHLKGTMFPRNYGPLAVLIYYFLLGVCSPYGVAVFLTIVVGALALAAFALWRVARVAPGYRPFMAIAIFATPLLSLPAAETELRGNIEGLLWIGYALGLGLMFSRRWTSSGIVLGVASCIKPYPALWLLVLFAHRKYKALAIGATTMVATYLGCLMLLGGGNPARGTARITSTSRGFFEEYIVGFRGMKEAALDHSLLETFKSIWRIVHSGGVRLLPENFLPYYSNPMGRVLLKWYIPVAALLLLLVLLRVRTMPLLNQFFALSICLTTLPFIAADYTLTVLFVPMGFFLLYLLNEVATGRSAISQGRLLSVLVSCAWLMAPHPYLRLWAGDARCVVLLALLGIVLVTPMTMAVDADSGPSQATA